LSWLSHLFGKREEDIPPELAVIRGRYRGFLHLLEQNHRVHLILGSLQEMLQGHRPLSLDVLRADLRELRGLIQDMIDTLVAIGGPSYEVLHERLRDVCAEVDRLLPGQCGAEQTDLTIRLDQIRAVLVSAVGGKLAQLGELSAALGLPIPAGFAITAWAYRHFVAVNELQERITHSLAHLDLADHADLLRTSQRIQRLVLASPVPRDLAEAIQDGYEDLARRAGHGRIVLRSSAIGENSLFSFAGQYASFLNVDPRHLVRRYREVLASKFTPQAICYYLSQGINESDLAMAVGCQELVDAVASGVIYTRDPIQPDRDSLFVHAVLGLGRYLVNGNLDPDVFELRRGDLSLSSARVARKPVRLVPTGEMGTREEEVPAAEQLVPALDEEHLAALARFALRIEEHYGGPQDIEWALHRDGQLCLLQTRPLRLLPRTIPAEPLPAVPAPLLEGGVTVCPGAGCGPVAHALAGQSPADIPWGAVLVARNPSPALITALLHVHALVTEVGGEAGHLATLAREYRVPSLAGLRGCSELPAGRIVTVDASGGRVFAGEQPAVLASRRQPVETPVGSPLHRLVRQVLPSIVPLNLVDPGDAGTFRPEGCRTVHDIARFCHQRAIEETFQYLRQVAGKEDLACRLISEIPLPILLIFLDEDYAPPAGCKTVSVADVACDPLQAFMLGMHQVGWPRRRQRPELNSLGSAISRQAAAAAGPEYGQASYAFISGEYMLLSLRMGYHFTTVEAMCTDEPSLNYVRLEHKSGGGGPDRRIRRVRLIMELLAPYGFAHQQQGDFLNTTCPYQDREATLHRLAVMGRLTLLTKQLDMALSNDEIAAWYVQDLRRKLEPPLPARRTGSGPVDER
jgi:pyruvate,water dikinase